MILISLQLGCNGNNINMMFEQFSVTNNPNLTCINVDDSSWSAINWTTASWNIDSHHYFSNNCSVTSIKENTKNRECLKVTDILGREVNEKRNTPLFYIYDDGTVVKKIIIE